MLKKFTYFFLTTKSDRRAYLTMLCICFIYLILNAAIDHFVKPEVLNNNEAFYKEYLAFKERIALAEKAQNIEKSSYFPFDPNTLNFKDAMQLGIEKKLFNTIEKYRKAGGKFYKKSDLKKIYGMNDELFEQLSPFIQIQQKKKQYQNKKHYSKNKTIKSKKQNSQYYPFDPNQISAKELSDFGINEYAVKNWDKFRNSGGKFYSEKDVAKVYQLSDTELEKLSPFFIFPEKKKIADNNTTSDKKAIQLFPFDPNEVSKETLINFGIDRKTAATWLKFRSSTTFYSIEDIQKIYGLEADKVEELLPYMQFPDKNEIAEEPEVKEIPIIELNTATIENLVLLPRVGKKRAKLIMDYREQLGGFINIHQLKEVFGISEEEFDKMEAYIQTDASLLKSIDINTTETQILAQHPYIDYAVANSIVKMKEQKGSYEFIDDLLRSKLIDRKLLKKIAPYLSL